MASNDKTQIVSADPVGPGVQLNGMYEIDERIAFGGMGEVYRGHNIQTGDPVAIKIVLPEFAKDESILALFRKEASILNHLSHDAIVRYHVFSIDPAIGRPYLAMEFVDGLSVADRMSEKPFTAREARKLLQRIASGLALAHEAGVIHRDLSPDNIILPGGNVNKSKIIDFGIARSATVGGGTLLGGKFAGKYNFVSPEQLGLFGGEVTERSDIYSLGLVIAGALRGEAIDMSGSQVEVVEKRRMVPDLSAVDDVLRPLLEAMLQPDPHNRPESADDIVEWLRATTERSIPPLGGGHQGLPPAAFPQNFGQGGAPSSTPPYGLSQPPHHGSTPPHPGTTPSYPPAPGSHPPAGSQPPAASVPPGSIPGASFPPGAAPPGGSVPPAPGSLPPPSAASPVNVLPPRPQSSALPRGDARPSLSSRTPLIALAALLLVAVVAAGAWFGGLFGSGGDTGDVAGDLPTLTPSDATDPGPPQPSGQQTPETDQPPTATPPAGETTVADRVGDGVAWLKAYDGGPCFYAAVTSISDAAVEIEGYGLSRAPFDRLVAAYQAANDVKPTVGVRLISEPQCPVTDFLRTFQPAPEANPTLRLSVDQLKFDERLSGTVDNVGGRTVNVLMIADDGVVYPLDRHLKDGEFGIKLQEDPAAPAQNRAQAAPNLVVTIASPQGVPAASAGLPNYAKAVFPNILEEMNALGQGAGVAVSYFTLGK